MATYKEKLLDPRWQRRRLEIYNRDNFSCRFCGDETTTLAVHHIRYQRGREPWQAPDDDLLTLCENCHEAERRREEWTGRFLELARDVIPAWAFMPLMFAIEEGDPIDGTDWADLAAALAWCLGKASARTELLDRFRAELARIDKLKAAAK